MPFQNFGKKKRTSLSQKKYQAMLSRVFKFFMKKNSLVHYFWRNFCLCKPELIEFRLFFANTWLFTPRGKIYNGREIMCFSGQIIRKALSVHHKSKSTSFSKK